MWTFTIFKQTRTTELRKDGILVSSDCYSGNYEKDGFNNPDKITEECIGPIPEGFWEINGPPFNDGKKGPYVMRLIPYKDTVLFGRGGFLIHGKPLPPADIRSGSDGCICADHDVRMKVWQSGDTKLQVVYS